MGLAGTKWLALVLLLVSGPQAALAQGGPQDDRDPIRRVDPSQQGVMAACAFKGVLLYGKVKIVESFGDFKVQVVDSFPDLKVQKVKSFPDKCGKWQLVESHADFTVQLVENFPDFRIQYVDAFPGEP